MRRNLNRRDGRGDRAERKRRRGKGGGRKRRRRKKKSTLGD